MQKRFGASIRSSVFFLLLSLAGCSSASPVIGDATDEALTQNCSNAVPANVTCDENDVLGAVSGARAAILERGFSWLHAAPPIPYSQGAYRDHYRTDCSGFVSMCWQTGTSFNTQSFLSGQGKNTVLDQRPGSYDELLPGDALVYRN